MNQKKNLIPENEKPRDYAINLWVNFILGILMGYQSTLEGSAGNSDEPLFDDVISLVTPSFQQ